MDDASQRKIYPGPEVEMSHAEENDLLCLLNAPEQYEVEEEMLAYAEAHPNATAKELCKYFDEIAPDGLPPCSVNWPDYKDFISYLSTPFSGCFYFTRKRS